jgi:hypothetical protein
MTSGGAPKRATVPDPTVRLGAALSGPQRAGALHDLRSIRKQTNSRVQVSPFLPAAFRPRQPRERLQGRSYRQRDDNPNQSVCERSRKNPLKHDGSPFHQGSLPCAEMAGPTPCGLQVSPKGN